MRANSTIPIDFVKLDRKLVGCLFGGEREGIVLDATIAFAKAFGWEVIAEGVESDKQRRWLEARSVDALQGYGVAHPMTAIDFNNWLEHRLRWHYMRPASARNGHVRAGDH